MPGDPYSDPVTGVLYNKLGLSTAAGLEAAEREITHAALILLHESPVSPSYDLPHLREIHKRIFGDIYERAGQIRTVAIAKSAASGPRAAGKWSAQLKPLGAVTGNEQRPRSRHTFGPRSVPV
jgi:cell filamentation protein